MLKPSDSNEAEEAVDVVFGKIKTALPPRDSVLIRHFGSVDVPVMASALRPQSFELCGAEADGAISWMCPFTYLRDTALPAMEAGAEGAGRPVPPLIAHIKLLSHQFAMPSQDRIRFDDGSHFFQRLFAELLADLGQGPALGVTEPYPAPDLVA